MPKFAVYFGLNIDVRVEDTVGHFYFCLSAYVTVYLGLYWNVAI